MSYFSGLVVKGQKKKGWPGYIWNLFQTKTLFPQDISDDLKILKNDVNRFFRS